MQTMSPLAYNITHTHLISTNWWQLFTGQPPDPPSFRRTKGARPCIVLQHLQLVHVMDQRVARPHRCTRDATV